MANINNSVLQQNAYYHRIYIQRFIYISLQIYSKLDILTLEEFSYRKYFNKKATYLSLQSILF